MKLKATFSSEAMLCLTFIRNLPEGWTAYPETAGFDILLSRKADGVQVGIEAKLTLNAKVIKQIVEDHWDVCRAGPDFRAVLIPYGTAGSLAGVCSLLGITVIEMKSKEVWESIYWRPNPKFSPELPSVDGKHWNFREDWYDWAPVERITLPDYIPDVKAGDSAPVQLTDWKIKAIKIAIIVEKRGFVTRQDFKALRIDHRRWLVPYVGWLKPGEERGRYVAGPHIGTFRKQHPKNYEQIAADYEKWAPKEESA